MSRPRVAFTFPLRSSFVQTDSRILSEVFDVDHIQYRGKRDLLNLARSVRNSELSFSWFALGNAAASVLLSRLFRRRAAVQVGGWDVSAMPELSYGALLSSHSKRRIRRTLNMADLVLAVSESNRAEALQWVEREVHVIPLGVDVDFFRPGETRGKSVVTVASITHEPILRVKGLDIFLEVARRIPAMRFIVIGRHAPQILRKLQQTAPRNVEFTGWLAPYALRKKYQEACTYAQLSAHESFGLAAAEAMACGCFPVVSDCGALPELVGPCGQVVPQGDIVAATEAVQKASEMPVSDAPRERIVSHFSFTVRRRGLLRVLERLA